jgi:hypothetical protein
MNRSSSAVAFAAATKRAEGSSTAAEVSAVMIPRRLCRGAMKLELHWGPEVMSEGSVTGGTGRHPILVERYRSSYHQKVGKLQKRGTLMEVG